MAAAPRIPCRILVIEDDEAILTMIKILLETSGYDVAVAGDGMAAVLYLQETRTLPDLILLDIQMPHIDGLAFRAMQQAHPAWHAIPVIFMSARQGIRPMEQELGGAAMVQKPFDPDQFLDLVARFCSA